MTNEPTKNSYAAVRKLCKENGLVIITMTDSHLSIGFENSLGYIDVDDIFEFFKSSDGWVHARKSNKYAGKYLLSSKFGGYAVISDPFNISGGSFHTYRSPQAALKVFYENEGQFYDLEKRFQNFVAA